LALFAGSLICQKPATPPAGEPPEEDESLTATETFAFNPLQASKEMTVGNYYAKAGKWKAAAKRYERATKWNPGEVVAWFKLGNMREKMNDTKGAKEAYAKVVDLAPGSKDAAAAKKRLAKL